MTIGLGLQILASVLANLGGIFVLGGAMHLTILRSQRDAQQHDVNHVVGTTETLLAQGRLELRRGFFWIVSGLLLILIGLGLATQLLR